MDGVLCFAQPGNRHKAGQFRNAGNKTCSPQQKRRAAFSLLWTPAFAGVTTGVEVGKAGYVYILASERNGTLYIGVASELVKRAWQHREGLVDGFSKRNGVKRLVYFEVFEDMANAIAREKAMKKWRRKWKIEAIELGNPTWRDLFEEIAK